MDDVKSVVKWFDDTIGGITLLHWASKEDIEGEVKNLPEELRNLILAIYNNL